MELSPVAAKMLLALYVAQRDGVTRLSFEEWRNRAGVGENRARTARDGLMESALLPRGAVVGRLEVVLPDVSLLSTASGSVVPPSPSAGSVSNRYNISLRDKSIRHKTETVDFPTEPVDLSTETVAQALRPPTEPVAKYTETVDDFEEEPTETVARPLTERDLANESRRMFTDALGQIPPNQFHTAGFTLLRASEGDEGRLAEAIDITARKGLTGESAYRYVLGILRRKRETVPSHRLDNTHIGMLQSGKRKATAEEREAARAAQQELQDYLAWEEAEVFGAGS